MSDEQVTELVAEPEIVEAVEAETPETEGQEGDQPEEQKLSAAKERREREKAAKIRLREELASTRTAAEAAEALANRLRAAISGKAEPKEADFPDPYDYMAAKAAFLTKKDFQTDRIDDATAEARAAKDHAAQLMAEEQALIDQAWVESAKSAAGRYADFQKVVSAPGLFPQGTAMVDIIKGSDVAGDLAYAIAQDKALHDDLLHMTPVEAARTIGRLEASLSGPKPRTSTQAPNPIQPVHGRGAAAKSPENMSMDEWIAARKSGKIK